MCSGACGLPNGWTPGTMHFAGQGPVGKKTLHMSRSPELCLHSLPFQASPWGEIGLREEESRERGEEATLHISSFDSTSWTSWNDSSQIIYRTRLRKSRQDIFLHIKSLLLALAEMLFIRTTVDSKVRCTNIMGDNQFGAKSFLAKSEWWTQTLSHFNGEEGGIKELWGQKIGEKKRERESRDLGWAFGL